MGEQPPLIGEALTLGSASATTVKVSVYWPTDDGWPYQDGGPEVADPDGELDEDLLSLRLPPAHLLDHLDPLEREVIAAHYGLSGPPRSMKQLLAELGLPRAELRTVLGSGLAKLRAELSDQPPPDRMTERSDPPTS